MSPISNSCECSKSHCASNNWPIWHKRCQKKHKGVSSKLLSQFFQKYFVVHELWAVKNSVSTYLCSALDAYEWYDWRFILNDIVHLRWRFTIRRSFDHQISKGLVFIAISKQFDQNRRNGIMWTFYFNITIKCVRHRRFHHMDTITFLPWKWIGNYIALHTFLKKLWIRCAALHFIEYIRSKEFLNVKLKFLSDNSWWFIVV